MRVWRPSIIFALALMGLLVSLRGTGDAATNVCVDRAADTGAVYCNGEEDNNLNANINCSSTTNPCFDSGDYSDFALVAPGLGGSNFKLQFTMPCGGSNCTDDGQSISGTYYGINPSITRTTGQKVYAEWTIKYGPNFQWGYGTWASPNGEHKTVRIRGGGQGVLFDVWGDSGGFSSTSSQVRMASMVNGEFCAPSGAQSGFQMTVDTEYHYIMEITNGSGTAGGIRAWVGTNGATPVLTFNCPTGMATCEGSSCSWGEFLLGGPQASATANNNNVWWYDNMRLTTTNIAPASTFDFDIGTTTIPNNQSVAVGGSTTANPFNITGNGQPTASPINLSAAVTTGSATGISFTMTPTNCTPPGGGGACSPTPTVTTHTTGSTTVGVRTITITANAPGPGITHTRTFQLTVQSADPPNPPTLTSVTTPSGVDGDTRLSIAFTPPVSGPTPDSYTLYRCIFHNGVQAPAACTTASVVTGITSSPYVDTFKVPSTTYTYQMTSVASAVESAKSNAINGTTTQVGIAPAYLQDINIGTHAAVTYIDQFTDATIGDVHTRYADNGDLGEPASQSLDAGDVPTGSVGKALVMQTSDDNINPKLVKNLAGIGANIATQAFVRYYIKPRIGDRWHHSSVTFGGYLPAIDFAFPRAGCLPPTTTVAGNYNLMNFSFEARDSRPGFAWDTYLYWLGMAADGTPNLCGGASGCLSCGCFVDQATCYFGNELGNPSSYQLVLNRWIAIEVMVTLNNPLTASNGNLAVWVDGVKTAHYEGYRWRNDFDLDINYIWIQHGVNTDGANTILKFANIVVAESYIGPLAVTDVTAPAAPTNVRVIHP